MHALACLCEVRSVRVPSVVNVVKFEALATCVAANLPLEVATAMYLLDALDSPT